jgi:hypothetical protein
MRVFFHLVSNEKPRLLDKCRFAPHIKNKVLVHSALLAISPTSLELIVPKFDYNAPAELFPSRNRKIAKKVKYRRFDHAADAIRFAVEELPEPLLLGAFIEMDDERLGHKDIRALYDSADYPLARTANSAASA